MAMFTLALGINVIWRAAIIKLLFLTIIVFELLVFRLFNIYRFFYFFIYLFIYLFIFLKHETKTYILIKQLKVKNLYVINENHYTIKVRLVLH